MAEFGDVTKHQKDQNRALFTEMARRRSESLRLYEPTEFQDRFHKTNAKECLLQAGNQVGKSLAAFVEDARALTGQDPYNKYPKENGILVCIGLDEGHIGRVIHKYLFESAQFRLIKDEHSGDWRAWKPWQEYDAANSEKTREAPPLIPERFIKGNKVWRDKGAKIFNTVYFQNGWTLMAFGSQSEPAAGFQADLIHIDEDIQDPDWYDEMIARLTMRKGKMRWSALPLARNDALLNVCERAEEEKDNDEPSTVVIQATVFDNPFMDAQTRKENIKRWKSKGEDEYRKRALGELTIDSVLVYPGFDDRIHTAISHEPTASKAQKIITENDGEPPQDWCRYMVVDPGHQTCAVAFLAVPPPEVGEHVVQYDELYLHQCTASIFGDMVARKARNQIFEAFIIDAHGGRLREIGTGVLPREQYTKALRERGISSRRSGHGFISGSDDIPGREGRVREWLAIRANGTPKFLMVPFKCHNTVNEFRRFKKARKGRHITDKADRSRNSHLMETLEYGAAHGLPYHKPPSNQVSSSWLDTVLKARTRRAEKRAARSGNRKNYINLGPTGDS